VCKRWDTPGRRDAEWYSVLLTVEDTGIIPQAELDDARKVMSDDEFQQEWYCSFEASIRGAYYAQELAEARRQGRIKLVPYDPILKTFTVWDLGKGPNMAVGFYQRLSNEVRWIDYLEGSGDEALPQMIAKVKNLDYVYGKHFAPHDIRAVELATGKTRLDTAKALGITFEVVPSVPVDDGIDKAKIMFKRLWINEPKCQLGLDAIAQYRREWDDNRGMFKETAYHDWTSHAADQLRWIGNINGLLAPPSGRALPSAPASGHASPRALVCRPARSGCPAGAPRSQAERGAARLWLVPDRHRRMG
jgi:phage terminase large subunit